MSDQISRHEPTGLGPALMIVIFLIVAIATGGVVFVYRQARIAQADAQAQREIALKREREIRQVTEYSMKQLAELEAKQTDPAAAAPPAETDPQRIADLHTSLGNVYLSQGERKKAADQFSEAVEVLTKAFGPDDARVKKAQDLLTKAQEPGH